MKLTLAVGTKNWSSWSLRGWLPVKLSGLPFEERYVRLRHDETEEEVRKVSPSGLVPLLTVEDGDRHFQIWDSLAIANADAVAMVGLCSLDPPNIAQVKERGGYKWLGAGYDLETPTLEAISNGYIGVSAGQQPYLQGYLPVRALVEQIKTGTKVSGWLEVPTDIVTAANVEEFKPRESDGTVQKEFYAAYMAENFVDLAAGARPYADLSLPPGGMATPTS